MRTEAVEIKLTPEENETLLIMAGYATGAAFKQGDERLGYSFLMLANKVNANNPNWKPYGIPKEYEHVAADR